MFLHEKTLDVGQWKEISLRSKVGVFVYFLEHCIMRETLQKMQDMSRTIKRVSVTLVYIKKQWKNSVM